MSDEISLPREVVQRLFDGLSSSIDFGSGCLESEDVEALRLVAMRLGVSPLEATPEEFISQYPHPYQTRHYLYDGLRCSASGRCGKPAEHAIHNTEIPTS